MRENLSKKFSYKSERNLENIVRLLLFKLLPICYLEGFADLKKIVNQQSWPKFPKFIFTSNNYFSDEVFKLWAATKVESGVKYFVGQHGNTFGTHKSSFSSPEQVTADKYITWGWTDGLSQHTPGFVFKILARESDNFNPKGGLLLIEDYLDYRYHTFDNTFEFIEYFKDQMKFVSSLANAPRQKLTIRLSPLHSYKKWSELSRWSDFDSTLKIEMCQIPIKDLIKNSRLVVYSYDSTGILESLSLNIPTIAFWQNNFDHLCESAKPYYQLLVDVGIVHFTAESSAAKVNEIWEDVDAWWRQSYIQDVRKKFCERYARLTQNPAFQLKQILLS